MRRLASLAVIGLLASHTAFADPQPNIAAPLLPDGVNTARSVTIWCGTQDGSSSWHAGPCNFGSGGTGTGGGGAVTQSGAWAISLLQGGTALSASNKLPVADLALDALISGGALNVSGAVSITGTPSVSIAGTASAQLAAGSAAIGSVGQTGAWTVGLTGALPAGANALGSVSVSNLPATQAVSLAALPALSAGAAAIGTVSVSNLPATQPVSSATNAPVAPASATATSSTLLGCLANTTLPTFTAGQQGAVPCDVSGRPYVVTVPSSNNVPGYLQAVSSGGVTPVSVINAAGSALPTVIKASGGMVYAYDVCNNTGAALFFRMFNQTTAPTVGTSTPIVREIIATGSCSRFEHAVGFVFGTGIGVDVTTGNLADSDTTTIAAANTVSVQVFYK